MKHKSNTLIFKRLGIHTQNEHLAYMREDCHVCISEGFEALTRIRITDGKKTIVASLNVIRSEILKQGEISLSESAMHSLGIKDGELVTASHLQPIDSLSHLRSKIYGNTLSSSELNYVFNTEISADFAVIMTK